MVVSAAGGRKQFIELNLRINGYDAGFKKDEYDCNLDPCDCQHYDQFVIGKVPVHCLSP